MSPEDSEVKYGNCYQFDLPDECLNEEETQQVIQAFLFDVKRTPVGEEFVLDIAIGPDGPDQQSWEEFVKSRKRFHRASYKKESKTVTREDIIDFLRANFADLLSLPRSLKRIK